MALATTIKGSAVRVYLGNGATPVVYTRPCGLSERSISFRKGTNEVRVPDCDDPDAPSWLEHDVESVSIGVSGQGVLATESIEAFLDAMGETNPIPLRIELVMPSDTYRWEGKGHITSFDISGTDGQRAQVTVAIESHGEMVRSTV